MAGLVVGLIVGANMPAVAQDERMGEDIAAYERHGFPEAGIAVSFPPGWSVDTWMWPDEFELPDESTVATTLVATAAGPDMEMLDGCEIVMYEDMPLSLEEHASVLEQGLMHSAGSGSTMPVYSLPIGDAFLVYLDDLVDHRFIEAYVFDSGTTRYHLMCEEPSIGSAWRPIAMSIEPLSDGPSEPQGIEVPGTGITIAFPSDWTVEPVDESSEFQLTSEYDSRQVTTRTPLIAFPDLETFCTVKVYEDMPMPLAEHADVMLERLNRPDAGLSSTATVVSLPLGEAFRIDTDTTEHGYWTSYLLDAGGTRLDLACQGDDRPEDDWLPIAETIEHPEVELLDEPEPVESGAPAADAQRVELPEAGLALSFPADWSVDRQIEEFEMDLPPEIEDLGPAGARRILRASPSDDTLCKVWVFEASPMSIEEHAAWIERTNAEDPEFDGTVEVTSIQLPAALAIRLDSGYPALEVWSTTYLVESGDRRYQLNCFADDRAPDDYLSIAESIELLGGGSSDQPDIPADAAAWFSVEDFGSVVEVVDTSIAGSLDSSLMRTDCRRALWIEHADGSFEERIECTLSEDPVDPPEWQGTWPSETVRVRGGACEWTSDYWSVTDGSEVWASSYELTVSPDGHVVGSSRYAAELLDCPE